MSMKVRVKFTKHGALRFIGHLDVMRYFQKAIRRAGIDVVYSSGFSPHQVMSFAAPLSVGLTSDGEYFDMEVYSAVSSEAMEKSLNDVMAEGIEVKEVRLLPERSKNAMASVAAAEYLVTVRPGHEPAFSLAEAVSRFAESANVPYVKKTAKSETTLDLKEAVYELSMTAEGSVRMLVEAGSVRNIKPIMVMEALYQLFDAVPGNFDFHIHRVETYLCTETEEEDSESLHLLPLGSAGERF